MQLKCSRKLPSYILCTVLVVAMALVTAGCNGSTKKGTSSVDGKEANVQTDGSVVGEGSKVFPLTVADKDGRQTQLEIHTDKDTVGEALSELGLIIGEEGKYGLFVKTVNGMTADYDKDGVYWAFYINGEYAQAGVDVTEIAEGDAYSFRME